MPRQARLDVPGTLHHVILRGMERGRIVADRQDREAFVARLGVVATATGTTISAWALWPHHAHLLLRSGPRGLPRFMRRVLPGDALTYNRRPPRVGPLVQNRYQAIVVAEDASCRGLVRSIHCNPLRAGLGPDLPHLGWYPWGGQAGRLGRATPQWQDRAAVLAWVGRAERAARRAYRDSKREGIPHGCRPELVGGGLVRSLGGWAEVRARRQRAARGLADARSLGTGPFVKRMLTAGEGRQQTQQARGKRLREAQALLRQQCRREQIGLAELQMRSRRRRIAAVHLVTRLGLSLAEAARQLGVSTSGVAKAVARAERP